MAEVLEHGRDKKILVFKYKNKTRYRRRYGHRQDFTRLAIRQIVSDGQVVEAAEKPKRPARKKPAAKAEEPAAEAVETPVVEAAEKPKRPARKKPAAKTEEPAAEAVEAPVVEAAANETEAATKPRRARTAKPKATAKAEAAPEATPEGE